MKNEPSFKLVIAIVIAGVIVSLVSPSNAKSTLAADAQSPVSEEAAAPALAQ